VKDYAIFVLETDHLVEEALKETLQNEGYTVYSFREPHQAYSYIPRIDFQLAIIDINTQDIGIENFVDEIKKKTPPPGMIITVYTPESEQIINLVNRGVDAFVIKPISMDDLDEVLSKVERKFEVYERLEELEEELRKLKAEKDSLETHLSRASVNISLIKLARIFLHELKNYLTAVNLSLHNLRKQLPSDTKVEKYIELISRSVNEANNLAMRILGMRKEKKEKTDINHLITETVEMLDFELRRQGVRVDLSFKKDLPSIDIDSSALKQAILNIILNAKEAMPSGGELKIKTDCRGEGFSNILIEIQDSGVGIRKEDMEKIFSAGFTTKEDGSGLGLYVTKKLITGLGGDIKVESKSGRGAKFTIFLPSKAEKVTTVQ
jgi:signal transduction histidine kinase